MMAVKGHTRAALPWRAADLSLLLFALAPLISLALPWWQVWSSVNAVPIADGVGIGPGVPRALIGPSDVVRDTLLVTERFNPWPATLLAITLFAALALLIGALLVVTRPHAQLARSLVPLFAYLVLVGVFFAYLVGATTLATWPSSYVAPSYGVGLAVLGVLGTSGVFTLLYRPTGKQPDN
jgi:hypothetical protein